MVSAVMLAAIAWPGWWVLRRDLPPLRSVSWVPGPRGAEEFAHGMEQRQSPLLKVSGGCGTAFSWTQAGCNQPGSAETHRMQYKGSSTAELAN